VTNQQYNKPAPPTKNPKEPICRGGFHQPSLGKTNKIKNPPPQREIQNNRYVGTGFTNHLWEKPTK
jgi:hypothetical protein